MRLFRLIAAAVPLSLSLCLPSIAQAQIALPVIEATEPLRALRTIEDARGWGAIGRLNSSASFCSGTLIAPDLVLTAAHCVFHPDTGRRFEPEELQFNAGLRNGRAVATRTAGRTIVLPSYSPHEGDGFEMIGQDLALVELARSIIEPGIVPLQTGSGLGRNDSVTIISYGRDRSEHASIEEGCHVLDSSDHVRSLDCSVVPGSSGSPVMQINAGIPRVVAVVSAIGSVRGDEVALAVTLDEQLAALMDIRVRGGSGAAMAASGSLLGQMDSGRNRVGDARFIRP